MDSSSQSSLKFNNICVFCGSKSGKGIDYIETAFHLGYVLATKKINFVYGGGSLGLMGTVSSGRRSGGTGALGIIPGVLAQSRLCGPTIGVEKIVAGMPERIRDMDFASDAFIALPGGLGTLDELFAIASWKLLGLHYKPVGLLNINSYFDSLLSFLDHAVKQKFLEELGRKIFISATTVEELLEKMHVIDPETDTATSKFCRKCKRDWDLSL